MLFNSEQHEVIARQLGRIAVSLHADGSNAVVTIEDTGLGISARLLPFIFDQYASWPDTLSTTLRTARGLALLHAVRPDAAIIDIDLPGMDGYQIAKRIRQDAHGRDMLLLAWTTSSSALSTRANSFSRSSIARTSGCSSTTRTSRTPRCCAPSTRAPGTG